MHSDQAFSVGYTAGDRPSLRTGSYTGRRAAAGQCQGEWPAAGLARPRLFQDADHSLSGQRRIHVDGQSFLQHLIENIEARNPRLPYKASLMKSMTHTALG